MKRDRTIYPDVSDILALKEEGRREISRRSFGEKLLMVEKMRERLAPIKKMREERRADRGDRHVERPGSEPSATD